jgi:hypothetical protein
LLVQADELVELGGVELADLAALGPDAERLEP